MIPRAVAAGFIAGSAAVVQTNRLVDRDRRRGGNRHTIGGWARVELRLRDVDLQQSQLLGGRRRRRLGHNTVDGPGRLLHLVVVAVAAGAGAVEVAAPDGEVEQHDARELEGLDAQRHAVGSPSQLVRVEDQAAAARAAAHAAVAPGRGRSPAGSLPQPTRRVDQRAEQQRCRDVAWTHTPPPRQRQWQFTG